MANQGAEPGDIQRATHDTKTKAAASRSIDLAAPITALATRRQVLRLIASIGAIPFLPRFARAGVGSIGGTTTSWATGGTVAMTDKATYPDPFTGTVGSCAIVAATTEGPCTTEEDLVREDVSEGWTGLPVRLALRVVDTSCNPLQGATVKIWHTNLEGSYSGQTPSSICLKQQSYASQNFFRGVQVTDADGTVFFDTCFPGWYPGRAVHIHFQVKDDTRSYRVSQLFFPEDVTEDIFADHSEYSPFDQPDTLFATDGIVAAIPAAERDRHILTVARMTDGAMLASKTVTVVDPVPVGTATVTPTESTTALPTGSATASPTGSPANCVGDCDDGGNVSIDELIRGVNITLGDAEVSSCSAFDVDSGGTITIEELIRAVNAALSGCGNG